MSQLKCVECGDTIHLHRPGKYLHTRAGAQPRGHEARPVPVRLCRDCAEPVLARVTWVHVLPHPDRDHYARPADPPVRTPPILVIRLLEAAAMVEDGVTPIDVGDLLREAADM